MLLSTIDTVVQFITVFLIFILVCALTYFTTRFVGGYQKGKLKGSNIQVIETFKVAQNRYIQIITVGERYFMISVCKDNIQLLSELNSEDITKIDTIENPALNFKDILENFKNKKPKK